MKIAVPVTGETMDAHFGQCTQLALFNVTGPETWERHNIVVPESIGCRSALGPVLALQGVTHVVAGQLGGGVRNAFESNGVKVIAGHSGQVEDVIGALLRGELKDNAQSCGGHGEEGGIMATATTTTGIMARAAAVTDET